MLRPNTPALDVPPSLEMQADPEEDEGPQQHCKDRRREDRSPPQLHPIAANDRTTTSPALRAPSSKGVSTGCGASSCLSVLPFPA